MSMNVLLAIAIALGTIPGAAPQVGPASAAQIEKLTLDGKADDAIDIGRVSVAAHPDDVDLRLALARALAAKARTVRRLVNVSMSQADIDRGKVAVPGADFDNAPTRIEYDTGLFEEAMLHLDFAIKRAPVRKDLRVFDCFLLTDAGYIDRAKAAIANALAALPKTPALAKTMAAYGAERAKRDDPEGSAELLAPVVTAFPKEVSILTDYGNVLTRLGRKTDAYAAFDHATTLAPKDAGFARTKALSAMLFRDYRRAQKAFDATFRLGRGVADEFASYAAAYGVDPKASAGLMRELGTPAPSSDASVVDLANHFVRAAKAGPSSDEALTLARRLVAAEQYAFAIPVLDRAVQASPNNLEAKAMLKTAYQSLGCPKLAP
jgi:tetratricopeptide (TPR) repeat protein